MQWIKTNYKYVLLALVAVINTPAWLYSVKAYFYYWKIKIFILLAAKGVSAEVLYEIQQFLPF